MQRFMIYQRVSTEDQAKSGLGMEAQLHACRTYIERQGGYEAGLFADEDVSGGAPLEKRAGLLEAVNRLKKSDVLIVAKRDRLGRGDPFLLGMIEASVRRKGARIVSAAGEGTETDGPTDVLMRRMVDAFAEYERLIIKARTKAALQAKRKRGEKTGGDIPFGYQLQDGLLIVDRQEQVVIGQVEALRAKGWGYRKIAKALNRDGFTTKQGRPWKEMQVKRVLERAANE